MNLPKPDRDVDVLFRQALEPYSRARASRDLWSRVVREIEEQSLPVWRRWINRLLAYRSMPALRTWDVRFQRNSEFIWELQLLPEINFLPRQILVMRLTS